MDKRLSELLVNLELFAASNDERASAREQKMLNITRDTGEFLSLLVKTKNVKSVLEIGTSNGYSTLWLANAAAANKGQVTTIEFLAAKIELAAQNFIQAGLDKCITQLHGDAGDLLAGFASEQFDLVFLDSDRDHYVEWLPHIKKILQKRGVLVVDNAISHAHELVEFFAAVKGDDQFETSLLPLGKGEFLAVKI